MEKNVKYAVKKHLKDQKELKWVLSVKRVNEEESSRNEEEMKYDLWVGGVERKGQNISFLLILLKNIEGKWFKKRRIKCKWKMASWIKERKWQEK